MHLSSVVGWLTPGEPNPPDDNTAQLEQESEHVRQVLGHRNHDPVNPKPLPARHATDYRDAETADGLMVPMLEKQGSGD